MSIFKRLLALFGPKKDPTKQPLFTFPEDADQTMEQALDVIWQLGETHRDGMLEIRVQGMGATNEVYHIRGVLLDAGELRWKSDSDDGDRIRVGHRSQFPDVFLQFADAKMKRFSDSNEYCFAVYLRPREQP